MINKNVKIISVLLVLLLIGGGVWFYNKYKTSTELSKSGALALCLSKADVNENGKINQLDRDFVIWTSSFAWATSAGRLDLNGDGLVSGPQTPTLMIENAADAFLGRELPNSLAFKVVDFDENGSVSVGEVQKVVNLALSMLTQPNRPDIQDAIKNFLAGTITIGQLQQAINSYLKISDVDIAQKCLLGSIPMSDSSCKKADLNDDGSVSIGEVQKFTNASIAEFAPKISLRADVNGDGKINDMDLVPINRCISTGPGEKSGTAPK